MDFVIAGAVINAPRLLAVVPAVGWPLSLLGIMVTGFLFVFTMVMVAEGADAKSALVRSKDMAVANPTTVLILCVLSVALTFAGFCALIVGFFVAAPIIVLLVVDTYFTLKAGQPAAGMAAPQAYPPQGYDPQQQQPPQGYDPQQGGGYGGPQGGGGYGGPQG
jgi:hypothetical protein